MINVQISEDTLLYMLVERVTFWSDDSDVVELFEEYYSNLIDCGGFDGAELDVMSIVDNDYVNWTSVYDEEDLESEDWIDEDRILARYNGLVLVDAR